MNALNLLKKHLLNSEIYVSLMGTLFAVFFMCEQSIIKTPTILLIFITYFSGYLYTKYQSHKLFGRILVFNVFCGIISMILIFLNHNEIRLFKWLVIVALGLLYNSSFLKINIRKTPLLKAFYVGLTWALINSWLILPQFNSAIFWISLLFISALVLPFDIRDMQQDEIVTFPKLIGVQNTKYFAYILIFISLVIAILFLKKAYSLAFFLTCIYTFILIYFSENSNKETYFSLWLESCSGMPLVLIMLSWLIK